MKILVLSNTPWRNDNSFGNSYSNIFSGMSDFEFANIYCKDGIPLNNICSRHFCISERRLIKRLFNKNVQSGYEVFNKYSESKNVNEIKLYNEGRKLRWQILFWARDILWMMSCWKSMALIEFIDSFDADILFFPIYYSNYINKVARFIKEHTNKNLILYVSDDVYSLRQFSISPFYWINRFIIRPKIKWLVSRAALLYVISDIQKKLYQQIFSRETKVLTKGADFKGGEIQTKTSNPIKLLYTGNIGTGRWKTLSFITQELTQINRGEKKVILDIYTMTPITKRMEKKLNLAGSSTLHSGVSQRRVSELQDEADVLVHVESFRLAEKLKTMCSFSTKIVDYFHANKCILAVGPKELASIQHLIENDAALIATKTKQIKEQLNNIICKPLLISTYAKKSWECGKRHHNIVKIQSMLREDIIRISNYRILNNENNI